MTDSDETSRVVDDASKRKLGALLAIGQGLLTAVAPGLSVILTRKLLGKNFENADALEAKPAYLRQVRALGIGAAAAGIAGYAMEVASESGEAEGAAEASHAVGASEAPAPDADAAGDASA